MCDDVLLQLQRATEDLFRAPKGQHHRKTFRAIICHRGEESGDDIQASFRIVVADDIEQARSIIAAELGDRAADIRSVSPLNLAYLRRMER
jgi:hypothetical protein